MGFTLRQVAKAARRMGIRGGLKTGWYSLRHGGSILISAGSEVSVARTGELDIEGRILLGPFGAPIGYPIADPSRIYVGPNAIVKSRGNPRVGGGTILDIRGEFELGDSYFAGGNHIYCNKKITIGDGCAISWEVDLLDDDSHSIFIDGVRKQQRSPIVVNDDVWIGHHASILKGVEIGEGSVVAANAVVTDDVPPYSLVAGVPATVIEDDVVWGDN